MSLNQASPNAPINFIPYHLELNNGCKFWNFPMLCWINISVNYGEIGLIEQATSTYAPFQFNQQ